MIPDSDRKVKRSSTSFATRHFHEDRNVTSKLGNLLVSFQWRNLIGRDLLADFQRWAHHQAPDWIITGQSSCIIKWIYSLPTIVPGVTVHHIARNNITSSLEMYEQLLEKELAPLINMCVAAHPQLEVVWMRQGPTVDYLGPSLDRKKHEVYYDKILKYNDKIVRIFKL